MAAWDPGASPVSAEEKGSGAGFAALGEAAADGFAEECRAAGIAEAFDGFVHRGDLAFAEAEREHFAGFVGGVGGAFDGAGGDVAFDGFADLPDEVAAVGAAGVAADGEAVGGAELVDGHVAGLEFASDVAAGAGVVVFGWGAGIGR